MRQQQQLFAYGLVYHWTYYMSQYVDHSSRSEAMILGKLNEQIFGPLTNNLDIMKIEYK